MTAGIAIEFGRCGFGFSRGLFPEARLGIVRAHTYHGSLIEKMTRMESTLRDGVVAMRNQARRISELEQKVARL